MANDEAIVGDKADVQQESKIYVAGHTGLIGSAICRRLEALGYNRLVLRTYNDLDLTRQQLVEEFFAWERFDYVFLALSNVGSAVANRPWSADVLYQNLAIESNIISSAYQAGVKRLLVLDFSGTYPYLIRPDGCEKDPCSGHLESANRTRAIAKIAGIEMCNAYNRQHGCRFFVVRPSNLYGPGDTYDVHDSRVIPAMILMMHWAKMSGKREVVLRGAGDIYREFLYSDDLANACIFLMNLHDADFDFLVSGRSGPLINIGGENDLTIRELAELVAEAVMFDGKVRFDVNNLKAAPQRALDVAGKAILRPRPQMDIKEGLQWAYNDFLSQARTIEGDCFKATAQQNVRDNKRLLAALNADHSIRNANHLEAASFSWCSDAQTND